MKRVTTGYKKYITEDELILLDNWFNRSCVSRSILLSFMFMRYMGIRVGDTIRMMSHNIQDKKLVFKMKKTGRVIELPIPDKLYLYLKSYMIIFKPQIEESGGYLCFSPRSKNKHISASSVQWQFTEFRRHYKLDQAYFIRSDSTPLFRISCHTLRHDVISKIYHETKDVVLCKDIAGHVKASTTIKYYIAESTLEDKKNALEGIM